MRKLREERESLVRRLHDIDSDMHKVAINSGRLGERDME